MVNNTGTDTGKLLSSILLLFVALAPARTRARSAIQYRVTQTTVSMKLECVVHHVDHRVANDGCAFLCTLIVKNILVALLSAIFV